MAARLFLELLSTECPSVSVHQLGMDVAVQAKIEKAAWVSAGRLRLLEVSPACWSSLGACFASFVDGIRYPAVTSWVSMEHWLQGSQVSKARPGAPIAFFRRAESQASKHQGFEY